MENKKLSQNNLQEEYAFRGFITSGFVALAFIIVAVIGCTVWLLIGDNAYHVAPIATVSIVALLILICLFGFIRQEPNEARVMVFFGEYQGTFKKVGFYWVNPFIYPKKLSLRARNLDIEPIKVNDKQGNPVMIGLMLVWKLKDTYKAMFEIDAQTMARNTGANVSDIMRAFENFVKIQSDAALRQVAGQYSYDNNEDENEMTLRGGADEINGELERKLDERLDMAGIEIVEARINYLAYAPEIAAAMLRRQQADAIISAREKIVEGAVGMVKMALDKLSSEEVVRLDDEKKAAMVTNLMVVLCSDDNTQPVVNAGAMNA